MADYLLITTYILYGMAIVLGIIAGILYISLDIENALIEMMETRRVKERNKFCKHAPLCFITDFLDGMIKISDMDFCIIQKDIEVGSFEDIWNINFMERGGFIE